MKKKLILIAGIVVVALLALLAIASLSLGSIIKTGVEKVGPVITKTDLKLDSASLSVFSGSGSLKGLFVGNPEGYKTESAIKAGSVSLGVRPASLFSDKIHVTHLHVQAPEITFEGGLSKNNLTKIQENVQAATGGATPSTPAAKDQAPSKKIQVDDLVVAGGKITVSTLLTAGKPVTVPLPDIHLKDLGKGADGVTPAEVTKVVLDEVVKGTLKAVQEAMASAGKAVADAAKGAATQSATQAVDKASKTIKGLLGK